MTKKKCGIKVKIDLEMWLRQQLQNRNEAYTQIMTLESAKASIVT